MELVLKTEIISSKSNNSVSLLSKESRDKGFSLYVITDALMPVSILLTVENSLPTVYFLLIGWQAPIGDGLGDWGICHAPHEVTFAYKRSLLLLDKTSCSASSTAMKKSSQTTVRLPSFSLLEQCLWTKFHRKASKTFWGAWGIFCILCKVYRWNLK